MELASTHQDTISQGLKLQKIMHFHILVVQQIFHVLAHIKSMSLRFKEPLCNQSITHKRNYHQDIFSLSVRDVEVLCHVASANRMEFTNVHLLTDSAVCTTEFIMSPTQQPSQANGSIG
jgi:hypothetical protein